METKQRYSFLLQNFKQITIKHIDIAQCKKDDVNQFLNFVETDTDKVSKKNRPTFFLKDLNRVSKIDPKYMNELSFGKLKKVIEN